MSPALCAFFDKARVAPTTITLASGAVEVPTYLWRFPSWSGEPLRDTYGGKALVECEGSPVFAEVAMIKLLKQHGFDGAVWVDSYRRRFRDAMPPCKCELHGQEREVYERIVTLNGGRGGCWDILAWNREAVFFVECKRGRKDRMRSNQIHWLESALKSGLCPDHFAICEWEIELTAAENWAI